MPSPTTAKMPGLGDPKHLGAPFGLTVVLRTWGSPFIRMCTSSRRAAHVAPRVPDGLTITPSPFRKQAGTEAPADLIPDNGQVERMNRIIKDATVKRYF